MKTQINLKYTLFLASAAALGGLLFGFDIAIITGAGPFLREHFQLNDMALGWAFSSLLFGCVIGSAITGPLAEAYGRKRVLLVVAVLFALTSVATGLVSSFSQFVIVRFLGGIAVGGVSIVSPMFVAEVSPPAVRGRMGTLYQISIVSGVLISYCVNYLLRDIGPTNWRWMFVTAVIPSAVFCILMLLAPETPRYLLKVGQDAKALSILEQISGRATAELELSEIRISFQNKNTGWNELARPGIRRAAMVAFCLAILVHVSGINTVIDYAPVIFQSAGWNIDQALLSTFAVGLTNFSFAMVSLWTIDRYGRKPLYIIGSLGMTICLVLLMATVMLGQFRGVLVLVLILCYLSFFSACIGPVFWTLVPEIFPNRIRGIGMTVPVLTQWVANAVVVLLFPLAFNHIGKALTFGFLALMALTQAVFTWFFVPETRGKALEEIEQFWTRIPSAKSAVPRLSEVQEDL